jgi:hypothetical protein
MANSVIFSNVVTFTANLSVNSAITANGTVGTAGQILTSGGSGANVYWSAASGGFTNGTSISVANLAITGSVTANGSVGTSGQALVSTGTGVQWGALSPGYNYSSQFNGSNQFLYTASSNSAFALSTGDFTVECWFYATYAFGTTGQGRGHLLSNRTVASSDTSYSLYHYNGKIGFSTALTDVFPSYSVASLSLNTWYHVAVTRASGVFKLFINGVLDTTVTASFNFSDTSAVYIGCDGAYTGNLYKMTGFISNARIVKGTAVYTSAFTPPTSPLSAISGTSLLVCNAITPTSDSSTNNFQINNNNGVTTTATFSPFTSTTVSIPTASLTAVRQQFTGDGSTTAFSVAGGYTPNAISVFLNGVMLRNGTEVTVTSGASVVFAIAPLSGALIDVIGTVPTTYSSITPVSYSTQFNASQSLTVATSTAFGYGTGDFTIEFWIYLNVLTAQNILSNWSTNTTISPYIYYQAGVGITYYLNGANIINTPQLSTGIWYHFAFVKASGISKIYLNGTQSGSSYTDNNNYGTSNPLGIGDYFTSYPTLSGTSRLNGYISNVRIVKGVAVYTNNFTVPSSPLAITQSASGAYIQAITGTQTSLLTCNGPTIIDGSTNAFTITNNGSAPVSTAIVPTFTNVTITRKSQTQTFLTSGSGTYYTPIGVVQLEIRMVGGGGGAGGGSVSSSYAGAGSAGSNTTFGTSFLTATAGSGADNSNGPGVGGGIGGTGTIGSGATGITIAGGRGSPGSFSPYSIGGTGGSTPFGGSGVGYSPGSVTSGTAGSTNSGSGGGGGGGPAAGYAFSGHGGGGGGYVEAYISNPASSYAYTVGTGGGGGTGSSSGNGGSGGSGIIIIKEYY